MIYLTDELIEVSVHMMQRANLTRGFAFGVPIDPLQPALGVTWKGLQDLRAEDYQRIEGYFLLKELAAQVAQVETELNMIDLVRAPRFRITAGPPAPGEVQPCYTFTFRRESVGQPWQIWHIKPRPW